MRRCASARSHTIFCVPTTRMASPARLANRLFTGRSRFEWGSLLIDFLSSRSPDILAFASTLAAGRLQMQVDPPTNASGAADRGAAQEPPRSVGMDAWHSLLRA